MNNPLSTFTISGRYLNSVSEIQTFVKIEFYTRVTVQDLCVIILTQKLIMIIIDIGVFLGIFSATSETDH